jgi:hypothetical protein
MTQVVKMSLVIDPQWPPLDKQIENECNVRLAAGYSLASSFIVGTDLILIFQKQS